MVNHPPTQTEVTPYTYTIGQPLDLLRWVLFLVDHPLQRVWGVLTSPRNLQAGSLRRQKTNAAKTKKNFFNQRGSL